MPDDDVDNRRPETQGSRESDCPSGPLSVMIVEDEALIAMDLEMQVEIAGHQVVATARTADEAIAQAETKRPNVALMDLRLAKGTSGIDAARHLYERWGIRCIFLSGNLDPATQKILMALKPYGILSKPVLPTQLIDTLKRIG